MALPERSWSSAEESAAQEAGRPEAEGPEGAAPTVRGPSVLDPFSVFRVLWRNRFLVRQLAWRDVLQRYRDSNFGLAWSVVHPLLMLGVYTFVFGIVFQARWGREVEATAEFGLTLFAGLLLFWLLAEALGRAPRILLEHTSYVKRIVFPLEILSWVVVSSALFHAAMSAVVLLGAVLWIQGSIPWTAVLLPLVVLPVALFALGACWFFSALGVYLRDLQQVMPVVITAMLFLTPIFYPADAVPATVRTFFEVNPLALGVEAARNVLLWGRTPDWVRLGASVLVSWGVAWAGLAWFQRTRRGFADVL